MISHEEFYYVFVLSENENFSDIYWCQKARLNKLRTESQWEKFSFPIKKRKIFDVQQLIFLDVYWQIKRFENVGWVIVDLKSLWAVIRKIL